MSPFHRREFLQRSAILSAAAAVGSVPGVSAAPQGPTTRSANDRLRVAVVGVRGRGMSHVGDIDKKDSTKGSGFLDPRNNCEIVTVCDCDEAVIGNAMKRILDVQKSRPKYEKDIRKVIEDKSIDIISIATPNHWHALMAVWAMRAGKDVYVEKPATHNINEGKLMLKAARKYNRICQVGTQSRSTTGMRAAIEYIHSGKIGRVDLAYATCYKPRKSIGKVEDPTPPPSTMNFDLWCGPAERLPVMRKNLHYDWHWTWAYGNGDLGNQGVHEMDKARWGLRQSAMPLSVVSLGGRFGYVDDGETANTQLAIFNYWKSKLIFEVRGLDTEDYKGAKVGNIWFGTDGYVVCPSYSGGTAYDPAGNKVASFSGGGEDSHFANFVQAVRSRNVADLNCDIAEGHQSAALCHLANISYRLGKETPFSANLSELAGTKEPVVVDALTRMKQHLTDNKVDLASAIGRVGPVLRIDTRKEIFAGGNVAKANLMMSREYRKGFDINEAV